MADLGYVSGTRHIIEMFVDSSSSDIVEGDFIAAATAGYVAQAAAGDMPLGVAYSGVASPSADGGAKVLVDISTQSIYRFVPDAGTVSAGLRNTTMDVGGPQSVNIDASTDDCLICLAVNTADNTLDVSLNPQVVRFAGVV